MRFKPQIGVLIKTTFITSVAFLLLLSALLTTRVGLVAQQPKSYTPAAGANTFSADDDKAIRQVIRGIEDSWNAHDMKAYGKLFSEDAEFINVVGMHWRGRKAIVEAHAAFHETSFKNHSIKTDAVEIRSLGERHAIAVVTTTNDSFKTPAGQVIPKRQNLQTYVLTKGPDGWKIAHGHNVPVDPDAAQFDPVNKSKK
jgi:uncharacterized protein (TIGR02246 family)